MALANDMTLLLNKIEKRLGLLLLVSHLPQELSKEEWGNVIKTDSLVTFSRYFPRKIKFILNDETTVKTVENGRTVYHIKDEFLGGQKLLGAIDIDWEDISSNNSGIAASTGISGGYGYYIPNYGSLDSTYETFLNYQAGADINSIYNNQIFVDFEYPNKIILSRAGSVGVNLPSCVIQLLVQHSELSSISPTMMETFEGLAQADIAKFLWMNLRYIDGLETVFVNIDLKLSELQSEADKRETIIEDLKNSYVSASNDTIPYILTTSG